MGLVKVKIDQDFLLNLLHVPHSEYYRIVACDLEIPNTIELVISGSEFPNPLLGAEIVTVSPIYTRVPEEITFDWNLPKQQEADNGNRQN